MKYLILLLITTTFAQGPLFHPIARESLYISKMFQLHNSASFNCVLKGTDSHALVKIRGIKPSNDTNDIIRTLWAMVGSEKLLYNIVSDSGVLYADVLIDGIDLKTRLQEVGDE